MWGLVEWLIVESIWQADNIFWFTVGLIIGALITATITERRQHTATRRDNQIKVTKGGK